MMQVAQPPAKERLLKLIDALPQEVGVLGDLMVDHYIFGTVERISPEAPIPVVNRQRDEYRPGGAANVAANMQALGARPHLFGVLGDDQTGLKFYLDLKEAGYRVEGVQIDPSRPTTLKTRVLARGQMIVRIDRESTEAIAEQVAEAMLSSLEGAGELAALSVSDYRKGVFTPAVASRVGKYARRRGIPVVANIKPQNLGLLREKGYTLAILNLKEAEEASGVGRLEDDRQGLAHAFQVIREKDGMEWLIITAGAQGSFLCNCKGGEILHVPTVKVDVFDVTGAGDTVNAVMTLALAAGAKAVEAAYLANLAGSVVVSKVGVATVSADELRGVVEESYEELVSLAMKEASVG